MARVLNYAFKDKHIIARHQSPVLQCQFIDGTLYSIVSTSVWLCCGNSFLLLLPAVRGTTHTHNNVLVTTHHAVAVTILSAVSMLVPYSAVQALIHHVHDPRTPYL